MKGGTKHHCRNNSRVFRTVQDAQVNRGTDEPWRCSHRAHDPRGDGDSRDRSHPVNDSASRSSETSDSGASETTYTETNES